MNAATGQVLRLLGMTLEALSLLGILSVWRGNVDIEKWLGFNPAVPLQGLFLLGLILWIIGLQMIRKDRRRRRGSGKPRP